MKRIFSIPLLLLIILSIIYGSSFLLIKKGLTELTPLQVASLRLAIAGFILLPFGLTYIKKVPRKALWYILLISCIGTGLPAFLFAWAQTNVGVALAGTLNSAPPLWFLLIGVLLFKIRPKRSTVLGIIIGFAGVIIMMFSAESSMQFHFNAYAGLIVLAGLGYASSMMIIQRKLAGVAPVAIPAISYLILLPLSVTIALATGVPGIATSSDAGLMAVGSIALLGIQANSLGFLLFARLIQSSGGSYASTLYYLIPIVATMWGIFDGEQPGVRHYIGMAVILIGVYFANRK